MRYAYGVLLGFILSGVIFIGAAFIKLAGYDVTESSVLLQLWNIYVIWVLLSICLLFVPVIVAFAVYRPNIKEIVIFEAGGLGVFTPFWFALAAEISGDSFLNILLNGVEDGLVFFNQAGELTGVAVGSVILVPMFILLPLIGIFLLRPSFVYRKPPVVKPPELSALTEPDPIETEMPDISPPVADSSSVDQLRKLLMEISTPSGTIDIIINAGYATITDLVATSPEQLASTTGLDPKIVQEIHLTVQKKVWFGGI
ncbi:MAG: helix-hairpin-helix domain-containing protein [Candidatus Thorarchaeota archaeon]|nr:helix-hairpin-helix domain-containing protein [Candidatus Thorarchaeota archaeon]